MKQKKINLSVFNNDYKKTLQFFKFLRIFTFIFSISVSAVFIFFFILNAGVLRQIDALTVEKNSLLSSSPSEKKNEAEILYVTQKLSLLDQYLKADTNSVYYFNLLSERLKDSSNSAVLESFTLDKNHSTLFKVLFTSREATLNYLRYIETEDFLQHFSSLSLTNIATVSEENSSSNSARTNYRLSFTGTFKASDENKN